MPEKWLASECCARRVDDMSSGHGLLDGTPIQPTRAVESKDQLPKRERPSSRAVFAGCFAERSAAQEGSCRATAATLHGNYSELIVTEVVACPLGQATGQHMARGVRDNWEANIHVLVHQLALCFGGLASLGDRFATSV